VNFADLKTEVFRRLNESATSPVFWEEGDVGDALNEGMEELADATEFYEGTFPISLVMNCTYYNLLLLFAPHAPDFENEPLRVTAVFNSQTNTWLTPASVRDLEADSLRWEVVTGPPEKFFMRGLWLLGLFPKPPANIGTVVAHGVAVPPNMTLATDIPPFPIDFHPALIEYALFDLLSQDGETKEALEHWDAYVVYEAWLADHVKNRTRDREGRFRG
jgi:hypothetical protein